MTISSAISYPLALITLRTPRRNPLDFPAPAVRALLEDMKAFFAEEDCLKRDVIAVRQLYALKKHQNPGEEPLRLSDIRDMFEALKEF